MPLKPDATSHAFTREQLQAMRDRISGVSFFGEPFLPLPPILAFEKLCDIALACIASEIAPFGAITAEQLAEVKNQCWMGLRVAHDCPAMFALSAIYADLFTDAQPTSAWQPITTAPKDGKSVILTNGVKVCEGGWISDVDQGADYEGQFKTHGWWTTDGWDNPTGWQPLPEAPNV